MNKLRVLLFLCGAPLFGQFTLGNHTGCNLTGTPSGCTATGNAATTAGITTTAATALFVCAPSGATVTDSKSNTWSLVNSTTSSATTGLFQATGTLVVGTGHTFTATQSGTYPAIAASAFSGSAATHDQSSANSGVSSVTSIQAGSITPTQNNELLISCVNLEGTETGMAINSPFTVTDAVNGTNGVTNQSIGMAYQIQTALAPENPPWSWTTAVPGATTLDSFKSSVVTTFLGPAFNGIPNQSLVQGLWGGGVSLAAQTAAISTATLCGAANCPAGQYKLVAYLASTVTCATPGPAVVGLTVTFTDDAGTKSAVTVPIEDSGALTTPTTTLALGTTTGFGFGYITIWSSGANAIQYATTYTACTTGTGTYSLRIGLERLQ